MPSGSDPGSYLGPELGTLIPKIGLELLEAGPDRMVGRIPVAENTQPYGILHGGATAALCETLGSIGTALAVGPEKRVMGIQLSVNHIRSASEGFVTGTAVPVHVGRTTAVWDIQVQDDGGRLVAVGRLTLAIREQTPDKPPDAVAPREEPIR